MKVHYCYFCSEEITQDQHYQWWSEDYSGPDEDGPLYCAMSADNAHAPEEDWRE